MLKNVPIVLLASILVGAAACGDSGGAGSGGGTGEGGSGGGASGGLCQEGKFGLSGDVAGVGVELSADKTGHALNQVSDPATYAIQYDGGYFNFAWTGGPVSVGGTTAVTGTARVNGTVYCFASGSLTLGGDGGFSEFSVSDLSESPDNGVTCPGTAVAGSLEGCADYD